MLLELLASAEVDIKVPDSVAIGAIVIISLAIFGLLFWLIRRFR